MTVNELIKRLNTFDGERIVVLSQDPEGNGYRLLAPDIEELNYLDGDIGFAELTPELEEDGYSEEDVMSGLPAVVLWPMG